MATLNNRTMKLSTKEDVLVVAGYSSVYVANEVEGLFANNLIEVIYSEEPTKDQLSLNQATWLANQLKAFTDTLDIPNEDQFVGEPGQLMADGEFKLRTLEDYVVEKIVDPHIDSHTRMVIENLWHEVQLQTVDADKWRALFSSDRLRVMGAAGFHIEQTTVSVRDEGERGNLHLGLEIWNKHPAAGDESDAIGRAVLMAYIDYRVKECHQPTKGRHQWYIHRDLMQDEVERLRQRLDVSVKDHLSVVLSYDEVWHLLNMIKAIPPVRQALRETIALEMFNTMRMVNQLPTVDDISQAPSATLYRDGADRVMALVTQVVDQSH